jgi:hypothetical protein
MFKISMYNFGKGYSFFFMGFTPKEGFSMKVLTRPQVLLPKHVMNENKNLPNFEI